VLNELRASPENTIYVGDSEVDVQTAKNAGIQFVGVTWGFRDRETLLQNGADILIDKPCELIDCIKGGFSCGNKPILK